MFAPASEAETARFATVAVRTLSGAAAAPLLICEHAGKEVPAPWRNLGLAPALLDTHFGWDAGAAMLTESLAARLHSPAVIAAYSRLFLDLNRFPEDWDCLRPDLGGIPVPANLEATPTDRSLRERIARVPFDTTVEYLLPGRSAVISIHSFTPLRDGEKRPTEIGVLWREQGGLGPDVLAALTKHGRFVVGDNQPYDWRSCEGYTLRRHGLDRGLSCLYLEIRCDLLATAEGRMAVADALAPALASACGMGRADGINGHSAPAGGKRHDLAKIERGASQLGSHEFRPENSRDPKDQRPDARGA